MTRGTRILRTLGLATVVTWLLVPAQAQAAAVGVADSEASTFGSHLFWGLWTTAQTQKMARVIVPYDIALRSKSDARRASFDDWLNRANFAGVNVNVGLERVTASDRNNPDPAVRARFGHAPDETAYRNAFRAFVYVYGSRVDRIDPWNEPNFKPTDGSRALLPGGQYYLDDPVGGCASSTVTVNNCGPRMAAYYYRWAAVDCPTCHLSAGEFAGTTGYTYIQRYKYHLGYHRPDLWSVHNYTDVTSYQVPPHSHDAAELKNMLGEIFCQTTSNTGYALGTNHCAEFGTNWSSGHLWVGATGALYTADCSQHSSTWCTGDSYFFGEQSQCGAAAFIMRFPNIDTKITRIYYYTYMDANVGGEDTGLTNAAGTVARKAYYVIRDHAQSCVY